MKLDELSYGQLLDHLRKDLQLNALTDLLHGSLDDALGDLVSPVAFRGILSAKDFAGVRGDGSDATAGLTAFINAINATPGQIALIPAGTYAITSALPAITVPVQLLGASSGIVPATLAGTVLKFSAGVPGLVLAQAAQYSKISSLYLQSLSTVLGTDDGINSQAHGTIFENLVIDGFGRDGVLFDSTSTGNMNNAILRNVRSINSKRDGFRNVGSNSNVITYDTCDASGNAGWGYNMQTVQCVLIAPHAALNTLGAYQDLGNSNLYLMPYSEGGTGNNVTLGGANTVWIQGGYSAPTITNTGGNTNAIFANGSWRGSLELTGASSGHKWLLYVDGFNTGYLALQDATNTKNIVDIDASDTRVEWLIPLLLTGGINGTTGTVSPAPGGAGALPATPAGYLTVKINGTNRQIPYY